MSATTSVGSAAPDSIFAWRFLAFTGDSWIGTWIADSDSANAGDSFATPYGIYTLLSEDPKGWDLSPSGLEDGYVFVEAYWDAGTQRFMPTRNGAATPSGLAGLGSEVDFAWNGSAWQMFGAGGAQQAEASAPLSLFTWRLDTPSGDVMTGTLVAEQGHFAIGDAVAAASGTYRIMGATALGAGDAHDAAGSVRLLSYWDNASRVNLALENAGAFTSGVDGLGSERDRAWTGTAWVRVGEGGLRLADAHADTVFNWEFVALSGDRYAGSLYASGAALNAGDSWSTAYGSYHLLSESPLPGFGAPAGTVWVTSYYDSMSNRSYDTFYWSLARIHTTTNGLGTEVDGALTPFGWVSFGLGGAAQVDVPSYSSFSWTFEATSGDRYSGGLWDRRDHYDAGSTIATPYGRYVITAETPVDPIPGMPDGTVWVTSYYDSMSDRSYDTFYWSLARIHTTTNGLGTEVDGALTPFGWVSFGLGGAAQVDVPSYSSFSWTFEATSGDRYSGGLWDRRDHYDVGSIIPTPYGRYVITAETPVDPNPGIRDGTVWVTSYYDSMSDRSYDTFYWSLAGIHTSTNGLGTEVDGALTPFGWVSFGLGGAAQVDVPSYSAFSWTFEATSGDRYSGGLWDRRDHYDAGSIIATPHGRYVITAETPVDPIPGMPDGTVWVTSYFDADSGRSLDTFYWTLARIHTTTGGLGSEIDGAWTGSQWVSFGLGGLAQVNVGSPDTIFYGG